MARFMPILRPCLQIEDERVLKSLESASGLVDAHAEMAVSALQVIPLQLQRNRA